MLLRQAFAQQFGRTQAKVVAELTTEHRQAAEAIAGGNPAHGVVGFGMEQRLACLLEALAADPLDRPAAEALLKHKLQTAAGVTAALLQLGEVDCVRFRKRFDLGTENQSQIAINRIVNLQVL